MHSLKFVFIMLLLISNTDAWRRRRRTKWFSIIPQDQNFQTVNIITPIVNRRCRRNKYYYELYSHISFLIVLYRGAFRPLHIIYFSLFYAYFFIFFILYFTKILFSYKKLDQRHAPPIPIPLRLDPFVINPFVLGIDPFVLSRSKCSVNRSCSNRYTTLLFCVVVDRVH